MAEYADLRMTRIPLHEGAGYMPALGFGTLIPDAAVTITATRDSPLPEGALDEINRIQTRQRLNPVVKTGVPGFIPRSI